MMGEAGVFGLRGAQPLRSGSALPQPPHFAGGRIFSLRSTAPIGYNCRDPVFRLKFAANPWKGPHPCARSWADLGGGGNFRAIPPRFSASLAALSRFLLRTRLPGRINHLHNS